MFLLYSSTKNISQMNKNYSCIKFCFEISRNWLSLKRGFGGYGHGFGGCDGLGGLGGFGRFDGLSGFDGFGEFRSPSLFLKRGLLLLLLLVAFSHLTER